ncbi:MAG: hypothetical protein Sapg2KO_17820 [Saprospiraceae bacterium]
MKSLGPTCSNVSLLIAFALILSSTISLPAQNKVYVNDVIVSQEILNRLALEYQIKILDGSYWYDKYTGAWGEKGGPGKGFVLPSMPFYGKLKANASNGNTNVFVNNRELHWKDVAYLQQFFRVLPGRFWVDAQGNGGYEGQGASFNLYQLARQSGKSFYRNSYTGIGSGRSGGTSYVIGKDFSVIID